jgi:hypothetical protein
MSDSYIFDNFLPSILVLMDADGSPLIHPPERFAVTPEVPSMR